jgi:hypothetical protein
MESIGVIRTSRDGHVGGPLRRSQQSHSTFEGRRARVHLSFSERTDATRREREGGGEEKKRGNREEDDTETETMRVDLW